MQKVWTILGLISLLMWTAPVLTSATLLNGDFTIDLTGWTTTDIDSNGGSTSPSASVMVAGEQAALTTQGVGMNIPEVILSQVTTLPTLVTTFQIDIGFLRAATDTAPSGLSFPDFVQVSYLDNVDIQFDRAFLGLDVNGPYEPTALTSLTLVDLGNGLGRFTTSIAALAGCTGTVLVSLSDQDDGFFSSATIDNVVIGVRNTAIPEPSTWLMVSSGVIALLSYAWRRGQRRS